MAEDGTGAQSGTTDTGSQSGSQDSQTGNGTTDSGAQSGTGSSNGTDSTAGGKSQAELDLEKQRERTNAADRRAAQLEAELKGIRDKDLPEAERMKRDLEETTAKVATLESDNKSLRIENAFLTSNTFKWKNPGTALKLLDRGTLDITSDGQVTGLTDALKALAKSDPYLLDAEADKNSTDTGPGATAPGNNGTGGNGKPDRKKMESRLPILRTRSGRS